MPKKEQIVSGQATLVLRLGKCLTSSTDRMHTDLRHVAQACKRVRNAVARWWQRWREDHSDWQPELIVKRDGTPFTRAGRPVCKNQPLPLRLPDLKGKEKSYSTVLYQVACREAPFVAAKVLGGCASDIDEYLTKDMPHDYDGPADYVWEAVLIHDQNLQSCKLDSYKSLSIPVPAQDTAIVYANEMATGRLSPGVEARLRGLAGSACALRIPLWGRDSGRAVKDLIARLEVRQLSAGNREVVRRVARGEWKLSDSRLVYHEGKGKRGREDGWWALHLSYQQPRKNWGLDPARVATLEWMREDDRYPFRVTCGDHRPCDFYRWGEFLKYEHTRLTLRRRNRREMYRAPTSRKRGHGRSGIEHSIRPFSRAMQNLMYLTVDDLVSQIVVDYCVRRVRCGTLLWKEPAMAQRGKTWLAKQGINWDWTEFAGKLAHKCHVNGVVLDKGKTVRQRVSG